MGPGPAGPGRRWCDCAGLGGGGARSWLRTRCAAVLVGLCREMAMFSADLIDDPTETSLPELASWVHGIAELTRPDDVVWCDGSEEEWERLTSLLVEQGTFTRLNPKLRPNSFWCASDPSDVARVEDRTFICSESEEDAGPTNNWIAPEEMRTDVRGDLRRLHARPHHVRGPVLHGPARRQHLPARRGDHRLGVRGRVDADHDQDGNAGAALDRGARVVRPCRPLGRRPAGSPARRTCRGRATGPSTSPTSPRPGRSGPTARGTAGTRCSARSATRCGSPR